MSWQCHILVSILSSISWDHWMWNLHSTYWYQLEFCALIPSGRIWQVSIFVLVDGLVLSFFEIGSPFCISYDRPYWIALFSVGILVEICGIRNPFIEKVIAFRQRVLHFVRSPLWFNLSTSQNSSCCESINTCKYRLQ